MYLAAVALDTFKDKAKEAIASGVLPLLHASLYFEVEGDGANCPLCHSEVPLGKTAASIELPTGNLTMHAQCFRAWQEAVDDSTRVAILKRRGLGKRHT